MALEARAEEAGDAVNQMLSVGPGSPESKSFRVLSATVQGCLDEHARHLKKTAPAWAKGEI